MAKADYIRRKWMKLIHSGNETHIITFLYILGVISNQQRTDFLHDTSMAYSRWWNQQSKQEAKISNRSYSQRPPRIIKATGARR